MSFDWRAYVELAGELLTHPQTAVPQEAYWRSAISRACYGVLWHERKEADYENNASFDIKRAMTAYQLANRVLARLKTLGAI